MFCNSPKKLEFFINLSIYLYFKGWSFSSILTTCMTATSTRLYHKKIYIFLLHNHLNYNYLQFILYLFSIIIRFRLIAFSDWHLLHKYYKFCETDTIMNFLFIDFSKLFISLQIINHYMRLNSRKNQFKIIITKLLIY
jgi:hypothetical protein